MRQTYGTQLTRDYLEYLGITEVSDDGTKIMKGDKELKQHCDGRYNLISLYDPAIRQACPAELRTNSTGQIHLGVHRVVYCWFNKIIPAGMVIDHRNSDKLDNRLENLQLFTPKENINKEKEVSTREIPCKMDRPRIYYEEKLAKYEALYEAAKCEHRAEEAHKQRTNIANIKARLRYYDNHIKEVNEMTELKKDLAELASWKKFFKETGKKAMWHECLRVEKVLKTKNAEDKAIIVKHALDVLHGNFGGGR